MMQNSKVSAIDGINGRDRLRGGMRDADLPFLGREGQDRQVIEKRRQTGPGRAGMFKPGAFGAMTVFIPAWGRRREKSSKDEGLIGGRRSGYCQSYETCRNMYEG